MTYLILIDNGSLFNAKHINLGASVRLHEMFVFMLRNMTSALVNHEYVTRVKFLTYFDENKY